MIGQPFHTPVEPLDPLFFLRFLNIFCPNTGLNGCFLIIGGIMLNALPFALLLRPATPEDRVNKLLKGVHKQFSVSKKERTAALIEMKKQSMDFRKH